MSISIQRAFFVSLKNGYNNIELLDELSRQAAPVKGYSNLGLYLNIDEGIKDIRKKAPLCFMLCDESDDVNKIKDCFDKSGNGAAFCFSKCIKEALSLGGNGDIEARIFECTNKYRFKIEKIRQAVSDSSMLF